MVTQTNSLTQRLEDAQEAHATGQKARIQQLERTLGECISLLQESGLYKRDRLIVFEKVLKG